MRFSIDIDEWLLRRAIRLTGLKTKREVVHRALDALIALKLREQIRRYRGRLRWRGTEVGAKEARSRAIRLVKRNKKLFQRLA
jgi:Arc/MetJ family transcription regulator